MTFSGVLIWTPDALLIRLADVEFFTLAVYRGALGGLLMLLGFSLYSGRDCIRQIIAIGIWGLLVALLEGAASWTFYLALERTTVANVLVIFASTPLIAEHPTLYNCVVTRESGLDTTVPPLRSAHTMRL